jgi:hypothetical protein
MLCKVFKKEEITQCLMFPLNVNVLFFSSLLHVHQLSDHNMVWSQWIESSQFPSFVNKRKHIPCKMKKKTRIAQNMIYFIFWGHVCKTLVSHISCHNCEIVLYVLYFVNRSFLAILFCLFLILFAWNLFRFSLQHS